MNKICPAARLDTACNRPGCSLVHTVYRCSICRAPFASQSATIQHESSPAHSTRTVYNCTLCSIFSISRVDYDSHVRGRKHRGNLAVSTTQTQSRPVQMDVPVNHKPCDVCNSFVPAKIWAQHVKGRRHRTRLNGRVLTQALDQTEEDKYGIQINCENVDFGTIEGTSGKVTASKQIRIINEGSFMVVVASLKVSATPRGNIFKVVDATRRRQLNRTNSTTVTVKLSASKQDRGMSENRLEMYFEVPSQQRRFAVTRPIVARIGARGDYEALRTTIREPYIQRSRPQRRKILRYVAGIRPQALAEISWVRRLKTYDIPANIEAVLSGDNLEPFEKSTRLRSTFVPKEFESTAYAKHMQLRLWIEEEHASRELSQYDMQGVELAKEGKFYELRVPGLAEKRPSVLFGDRFFVNTAGSSSASLYEGFVHKVKNQTVLLCFNRKFPWSTGMKYDVRFDLNRLIFRRMHQGVTRPTDTGRITFPSLARELLPVSSPFVEAIVTYDSKVAGNEPQRRAIASIVGMPAGSIPFIIYGPPGTGKTVTLVEAIRQVLSRNSSTRVLACAPSNSAADILVERLSELGKQSLFRLIAPSRSPEMVSSTVLMFTRKNTHNVFECPPREELKSFRVVVSTCCSGGVPYGIGFDPGHFTHIFIDEAAQATEPEVMIPIKTMLGPKTNVILAGDVKQLGPIIRSPIASEFGLGISFVERLMGTALYDEARAKGRSIVKLTKNYRSHPAILDFPNAQFYKNELEACARKEITHSISERWDGLIKENYPVIFHGVCGRDMREDPSPSYFNIDEAVLVKDYVRSLLDANMQLDSGDIGVITPYRAQVLKIRQLLRAFAGDTRVGSVEEFQGQEKKIIIISTVRSSPDLVTFDLRHTLGFVANPRRFNVAVTRAQALLIVVGDPYVLALDPMWKEFINSVHLRGGYTGVALDWDPAEPVDHTARLDKARRAQGLSELEELIWRTSEGDIEERGPIREED